MTGLPDSNSSVFNVAALTLRSRGYLVLNPAESFGGDMSRPRADYMRADIGYILRADIVAQLAGWETSPGARLEALIAEALGLSILELEELL